MDRRTPGFLLAPGASGAHPLVLPGPQKPHDLPPVDEHAVEPETRQEMIDGQVIEAAPSHPPHGDRHSELDYVLRANVAPGYVASVDLLTRTSANWNFAADSCIRKEGIDPGTGRRYLEELAFEIKYTQRWKDLTARARQLTMRGVRRVFVIAVASERSRDQERIIAGPVYEWSPQEARWLELDPDARIEDPSLRCPIQVRALINAAAAHDAVAQALVVRGNALLRAREEQSREQGREEGRAQGREEGRAQGREEGRAQGLREGIADLCEVWNIELTPERRARMQAMDAHQLQALRAHIKARRDWDE